MASPRNQGSSLLLQVLLQFNIWYVLKMKCPNTFFSFTFHLGFGRVVALAVALRLVPTSPLVMLTRFYIFFFVVFQATFIWKGYMLPYTRAAWYGEYFGLWILSGVEIFRIYFGMRGNLTETVFSMTMGNVLALATIVAHVFYLVWQTYVLRLEYILLIIGLVMEGLELLLGVFAALSFNSAVKFQRRN